MSPACLQLGPSFPSSPQCVQRTWTVFYGIGLQVASRPQLVTGRSKHRRVPPKAVNTRVQLSTKSPSHSPGTTYLPPAYPLPFTQICSSNSSLPPPSALLSSPALYSLELHRLLTGPQTRAIHPRPARRLSAAIQGPSILSAKHLHISTRQS
jgi:hypothetical protein